MRYFETPTQIQPTQPYIYYNSNRLTYKHCDETCYRNLEQEAPRIRCCKRRISERLRPSMDRESITPPNGELRNGAGRCPPPPAWRLSPPWSLRWSMEIAPWTIWSGTQKNGFFVVVIKFPLFIKYEDCS